MKKSKNRILAAFLTIFMLMTVGSSLAFAAENPEQPAEEQSMTQEEATEEVAPATEEVEDEVIGKITAIEIRGNVRVDVNTIRSAMKTKVGDVLTLNGLIEDLNAVAELGWFTGVDYDFTSYLDGARYIVYVQEFPKASSINIAGNTLVSTTDIQAVVKTELDKIINYNDLRADSDNISNLYQEKGYFCAVDIVPSSSGDITFNIIELKVGEVGITGNEKTKSDIILKELKLTKGDYLEVNKLNEDMRMLYMTGAFEIPELDIQFIPGTADQVSVTYVLTETKSGMANTGITFSPSEGLTGYLELGSTNLFGRLEKANVKASLSNTSIDYELDFNVPWFINSKNSLSLSLGDSRTEWTTSGEYDVNGDGEKTKISIAGRTRGGSITYGRALNVNTILSATLKINQSTPSVKDIVNKDRIEELLENTSDADYLKNSNTISLGLGLYKDTRDNTTAGTEGYTLRGTTELGFTKVDGNNDYTKYLKLGGTVTGYHTLFKNNVLAGRISAGTSVKALGYSPKYYLGGSETVRGYSFQHQSGENMIYANLENRYTIAENFDIVAFVDAGYAWDKEAKVDFGEILVGYGLGLRVNVPFLGTIRLDYAFNKEGKGQPSFSFGHMF